MGSKAVAKNDQLRTELRAMVDQMVLNDEDVSTWIRTQRSIDSVERIPGDASTRRYYRVRSQNSSMIVMRMEPFADQAQSLPFLVIQKHLAEAGVDVPGVLDADPDRGFILLEDLGDETLLRRLQGVGDSESERVLYEKAIDALVQLQWGASPARKPAHLEAFRLKFDEAKLMWEVNFAIEHFYQTYLKRSIKESDLQILQAGFQEICKRLSDEPTVLTHRDYHSRNIMCSNRSLEEVRLVMIDFQDARMGPPQYDLASLLKDSYYQLEEAQVERLIDYYLARWKAVSEQELDRRHFREIFDLMSVQRNFKAIGSFASFINKRSDATYLKYIGNTFENIRRTLLKYPRYAPMREVLFHYYYF